MCHESEYTCYGYLGALSSRCHAIMQRVPLADGVYEAMVAAYPAALRQKDKWNLNANDYWSETQGFKNEDMDGTEESQGDSETSSDEDEDETPEAKATRKALQAKRRKKEEREAAKAAKKAAISERKAAKKRDKKDGKKDAEVEVDGEEERKEVKAAGDEGGDSGEVVEGEKSLEEDDSTAKRSRACVVS